jgi:23S rRNA pseudouridine1911/1915/1917 synthase
MDNVLKPENIPLDIVYEDKDILVLNKIAGMLVHPDKYNDSGTLANALLYHYPEIKGVGEKNRPGIIHRLDKETSGLLIVAKNQDFYDYFISQFLERKIVKKYKALVYGLIKEEKGVIVYSIPKKGRKEMLEAKTYYMSLEYYKDFTLLDIEIKTGRMHQIRQHMKKIGHPIVGDTEYTFKNLKPPYPIGRYFLHSYYLKFKLPDDECKEIRIGLPKILKDYLKKLPK